MSNNENQPVPAPSAPPSMPLVTEGEQAPAKQPWYKRKAVIIPACVVGGLIVISAMAGGGGDDEPAEAVGTTQSEAESPTISDDEPDEPAEPVYIEVPDVIGMTWAEAKKVVEATGLVVNETTNPKKWEVVVVLSADSPDLDTLEEGMSVNLGTEDPKWNDMTLAQENAVEAAVQYIDIMPFSKAGLFDQMTSEYGSGYEDADANYAIEYLEAYDLVDWMAEAVESAESYLNVMAFSRQGLYDQLTSEHGGQFTAKQAEYALKQVGY